MSHSQFHSINLFILRHAWLNLWDKHMTTGRINQVTIPTLGPAKWPRNQSDGKPHCTKCAEFAIRVFSSPDNSELFSRKLDIVKKGPLKIIRTGPRPYTPHSGWQEPTLEAESAVSRPSLIFLGLATLVQDPPVGWGLGSPTEERDCIRSGRAKRPILNPSGSPTGFIIIKCNPKSDGQVHPQHFSTITHSKSR